MGVPRRDSDTPSSTREAMPKSCTYAWHLRDDVVESLRVAVGEGLYTALNLLVFPGVTDQAAEVEALEQLIGETGLHMVHLRNLSIDPRLYLENLPKALLNSGDVIGLRNLAILLKRAFPGLDLGYFNRPKEDFVRPLVDELPWAHAP